MRSIIIGLITISVISVIVFSQHKEYGLAASQIDVENDRIESLRIAQDNEFSKNGRYKHIKNTEYVNQKNPSKYRVDEYLYPDGTRGYRVLVSYEEEILTSTSTYKILKQRSVGFGPRAEELTWER